MNFRKITIALVLAGAIGAAGYFAWQNRPKPALETKFVQNVREAIAQATDAGELVLGSTNVEVKTPPSYINLGSLNHSYQTFNNCGPATMSMALGFYGIKVSQKELGDKMRPYQVSNGDNDDKTIFTEEFVMWAKSYGLEAIYRPNGDIETLKKLTANGFPVVVKTFLHSNDDVGHFRIVKGYDSAKQVIIQDDSFEGPNREISYYDFLSNWQPFHYIYIVVYKPEQKELVEAIIGEEMNEDLAWENVIIRSEREQPLAENVFPTFSIAVANYHLGNYEKAVAAYESVADRVPRRLMWYQLEPILAMQKLGQYDKILALSERILNGGNRAFSELYQIRGEVYLAQGNTEAARAEFEKAVQYNVNYEPAKAALRAL